MILSQRRSRYRRGLLMRSRGLSTSVALVSVNPLPLTRPRLEMRRGGCHILSSSGHGAPHLVPVCVDYAMSVMTS